jgi:hypothetical protein
MTDFKGFSTKVLSLRAAVMIPLNVPLTSFGITSEQLEKKMQILK